ncbi:Retrovirus-related Pol polyprotein from transposon TNT 1-94 [Sesamum angolense]|uniref:Retrovirus-related Pol polyprotein from transposon TNT 1-94 n=1 Tax=Sesamum angolense TaxID=2727404 RepID=A0AAE1XH60_9LAMI|nr:Retrovirus-related Pol polyprotein from transposon TNT 1-94 [Sesamum angolense]
MTAQNKRKLEKFENAQIWHVRLGHISQDRMKGLVDLKSVEIDNLDNLPAYESCLKGKMTRKPFVGQSKLANGLLNLIHTDFCGPLNTQGRGRFSYFIIFTDDHSRYSYVYLMRYKSEAFVRFKEFRLEVENQTCRKIKTLRSDRSGEYLSGEFIDYLKENGIVSQWTPPETPQQNDVAESRNRTLLDMIRAIQDSGPDAISDMEHKPASYKYLTVLGNPAYLKRLVGDKLDSGSSLCRFIGYPKETAGYYFSEPSEQKVFVSRNAVFLERGFPTDTRRDELLIEESSEAPQSNAGTSSAPTISTDNVPILCRSARVPQLPERYGFLGMIEGFTIVGEEQKVCHLQRSIYGLKQASRSWNIHFDGVIRGYDFVKNDYPCVYKKVSGSSVMFLVLYVDDILLIGNDIKMLRDTKAWLSTQFSMKDLGEASYILEIKIFRDRFKRILGMTQNSYQACAGEAHWTADKIILKYLRRTKDVFLVYGGGELILEGFSDQSVDEDQNHSRDLYSSLIVVWWLGRVPSRILQLIPPRKLST